MTKNISKQARYEQTRKVTLIGVLVNIILMFAQLLGGFFSSSQALIADGIHTLSDLISDFIVLFAAKIASQDADESHPYGHGRFETLATVILGIALAAVAIGILISAVTRLANPESLSQPSSIALIFAAFAIISKEGLYYYTMRVAKRINSKMLIANAWHHRSDAISSILVAIGVAGSVLLDLPWLDTAAAIAVAIMILYMGLRLLFDSTKELVDSAWDGEKIKEMTSFINTIEGVDHLHMLRTRKMGNDVLADVHLQVNAYLSVSEGHFIAETTMAKLYKKFPELSDITVHIDPEDDETASLSVELPNRQELMKTIYPIIQTHAFEESVDSINLHYIKGKVEIELVLNKRHSTAHIAALKADCQLHEHLCCINVLQRI